MVLINKKEVRILFVPSFSPGSFFQEGMNIKEIEDKKSYRFEKSNKSLFQVSLGEDLLRELSIKAEVEKGNTLLDGNIRYVETAEKQNFNHSIVSCDNNIIVLGHNEILLAKLYHWESYVQHIQQKCGWLVCLKAALDIYSGELKGYYGVPYIAHQREAAMMNKLKDLARYGINELIKQFHGHREQTNRQTDYKQDNDAIKVAIEF